MCFRPRGAGMGRSNVTDNCGRQKDGVLRARDRGLGHNPACCSTGTGAQCAIIMMGRGRLVLVAVFTRAAANGALQGKLQLRFRRKGGARQDTKQGRQQKSANEQTGQSPAHRPHVLESRHCHGSSLTPLIAGRKAALALVAYYAQNWCSKKPKGGTP